MRVKITFNKNNNVAVPINNIDAQNSFLHKILGANNIYHDIFSEYSISSLQGGKLDKNTGNLIFTELPYIYVSSLNYFFLNNLLKSLGETNETLCGMTIDDYFVDDFKVNRFFDKIITISPILLKNKDGRSITFKDNEWLNLLKINCIKKLEKLGIYDNTFDIEIRNIDKAKTKKIQVSNDAFAISSMISLTVYGKPETRHALYCLGLGKSTGSGFGAIRIL